MHTQVAIGVAATPRRVFDLARDIARWPDLLPHYRKVTVHSRSNGRAQATMNAVRPVWRGMGIPVWWRTEAWADDSDPDDLQLLFRHVGGATRGMVVAWHIRASEGGASVVVEHEFRRSLPFLGSELFPRIVDRFFVRPIATRTLARFKALAESGAS